MNLEVTSARAHDSGQGVAVFFKDAWNHQRAAMIVGSPVVEGMFRMAQLMEWTNALAIAIETLDDMQMETRPIAQLNNAANSLSFLQGKLEMMLEEGYEQHRQVVPIISENQPDLMQAYLSAFTAAVGQGDL
jgi:hypothetical protein